jgi:hypothetical protein
MSCRSTTRTPRYAGPKNHPSGEDLPPGTPKIDFIVCERVADLATPPVPSEKSVCMECDAPVWVSREVLAVVVAPSLCVPCALKKLKEREEE